MYTESERPKQSLQHLEKFPEKNFSLNVEINKYANFSNFFKKIHITIIPLKADSTASKKNSDLFSY